MEVLARDQDPIIHKMVSNNSCNSNSCNKLIIRTVRQETNHQAVRLAAALRRRRLYPATSPTLSSSSHSSSKCLHHPHQSNATST